MGQIQSTRGKQQLPFAHQVVLVTGGTSGIGLATAAQFILAGAQTVIVCGRTPQKWSLAQNYLSQFLSAQQISRMIYKQCDVRVESDIQELLAFAHDTYGHVDVYFNCAGVQPVNDGDITKMEFQSFVDRDGSILYRIPPPQPRSPPCSLSQENNCPVCPASQQTPATLFCETPLATSAIGIFYCLKWQMHYAFSRQPRDLPVSIVSISSRNGILPDSHRPIYAASKAFILSLTRSIAAQAAARVLREKRPAPVRINAISPGPVDTPLERAAFPGSYEHYVQAAIKGVPMGRTAKPEEMAPIVLFLSNPLWSGYITGTNIPVDGGNTGSPVTGVAITK